jgi:hypothetical protein
MGIIRDVLYSLPSLMGTTKLLLRYFMYDIDVIICNYRQSKNISHIQPMVITV